MTLQKICEQFRKGFLGRRQSKGRCWLLSVPLKSYLELLGHEVSLIYGKVRGEPHVWLECNGQTIDVTADQFSTPKRRMPKVFIGARPKWYKQIVHENILLQKIHRQKNLRR